MKRELREESKREENREKIVELKKLKSDTREGYIKGSFFNFSLILSFVVMFKSLYSIINEKQYGYSRNNRMFLRYGDRVLVCCSGAYPERREVDFTMIRKI